MTELTHKIFCSRNEDETTAIAENIANLLKGGEYISLEGDLGAGKTFFSRALARAFGITAPVTSPTYLLQKSYPISGLTKSISLLVHYDFYRVNNYEELLDLGFEDHDRYTVVLVEWGDLFIMDFPRKPIRIKFVTQSDNSRLIAVDGL